MWPSSVWFNQILVITDKIPLPTVNDRKFTTPKIMSVVIEHRSDLDNSLCWFISKISPNLWVSWDLLDLKLSPNEGVYVILIWFSILSEEDTAVERHACSDI